MKIYEFDLPLQIYPKRPYRINKLNLIILPTDNPAPRNDYTGPQTTTRIIIYNTESKTIKKIITDLVIFINFLNQEFYSFFWLFDRSFTDLSKYERNINNIDKYVKDSFKKHDWYRNVDYNHFPLLEIRPDPTLLNFRYYFAKFHQLPSDSKLRTWISFLPMIQLQA